MTQTRPTPKDRASGGSASRQAIGIWIGAGLGVLVVAAVLLATLVSGGDDDSAPPTVAPPAPGAVAPTGIVVTGTVVTPEGDYAAFCKALLEQTSSVKASPETPEEMVQLVQTVDFSALAAVAPEGLRPSLQVLADTSDEVLALFEQLDDFSEVTNADFPAGFLDAARQLAQATQQKCL